MHTHTLPTFAAPTFTMRTDGSYVVDGTNYTIELGATRWRVCHDGKSAGFGFRTLAEAKTAFCRPVAAVA